jgi:hypothetical protein
MTQFNALVILPQNTANIQEKVAQLLSPYYSELEVEPYKEYLNQAEFQAEMQRLSTFITRISVYGRIAFYFLSIFT